MPRYGDVSRARWAGYFPSIIVLAASLVALAPLTFLRIPQTRAAVLSLLVLAALAAATASVFGPHRALSFVVLAALLLNSRTSLVSPLASPVLFKALVLLAYCALIAILGRNWLVLILGLGCSLGVLALTRDPNLGLVPLAFSLVGYIVAHVGHVLAGQSIRIARSVSRRLGALAAYFAAGALLILWFAVCTQALSLHCPGAFNHPEGVLSFSDALYQSAMVFATIGPAFSPESNLGRIAVAAEALCSVLLFGLYVGLILRSLDSGGDDGG